MRIVFVNHDAGVYGATKSLLDLIQGLTLYGVTCYVIIPWKGPLQEELERRNISYKIIYYKRWVHSIYPNHWIKLRRSARNFPDNRVYRAMVSLIAAYQIKKCVDRWRADVVYTNTSVIVVGALAAYLSHKKHVWHIREFQKIDQKLRLDWGNNLLTRITSKTDAIVFISEALQRYYQLWVREVRTKVIYNGVATQQDFTNVLTRKQKFSRENHTFTFCIVGRISYEKGQHETIKAVNILVQEGYNLRLLIAGKGHADFINSLIDKFQLQSYVQLIGHVDDPYESIYFHSDACLMCSAHEGFGRVTVEAMVCGLPVIGKSSQYTGTTELITHKQTGLLYEGNEVELANAMKELLKNPEWSKDLGYNAWKYAKDHLNREGYVKQVYELLKSL